MRRLWTLCLARQKWSVFCFSEWETADRLFLFRQKSVPKNSNRLKSELDVHWLIGLYQPFNREAPNIKENMAMQAWLKSGSCKRKPDDVESSASTHNLKAAKTSEKPSKLKFLQKWLTEFDSQSYNFSYLTLCLPSASLTSLFLFTMKLKVVFFSVNLVRTRLIKWI